MKKALSVAVMLLAVASMTQAEFLEQDTRILRIDGVYDDDADSSGAIGGELGFGVALYSLDDVGIFGSFTEIDDSRYRAVGVYGEEHYLTNTPLVPFIGAGLGYAWGDPEFAISEDDWIIRVSGGLKVMLHDSFAIAGSARYSWSADDLFLEEGGKAIDHNFEVTVGLRFHY